MAHSSNTFSIITVVYNDVSHILETMDSVISQTYKNIEYILIDGSSTDGTREAIFDFLQAHTNITHKENIPEKLYLESTHSTYPTLTFKFLSQKDGGIYDAMNKGIALATKEWINFMNCGDRFYDSQVLEKIASENIAEFDVVYGDTKIKNLQGINKPKNHNHKYHHQFVHQSSIIKTELMRKYPFDTSFKIAGDTDFFTKIYNSHHHFFYFPIIFSYYNNEGISNSLSWKMFYENCKIGYKYNKLFPFYLGTKYILWTIPKRAIQNIFAKYKT